MNNFESIFKNNSIKIIFIFICLLYIISPYDILPDLIPIGRFDDLSVFILGFYVASTIKFKKGIVYDEKVYLSFKKAYPDIEDKYKELINSIGDDSKYKFYREEASKVLNELLRVYLNIIESNKRLENFARLKENLLPTINNTDDSPRAKEGAEKSKQLINRIDKESDLLKKYIQDSVEEIKATKLDFIHVTTEIELAKASGQIVDLAKLSSRSQSLSYIASNLPTTTGLNEGMDNRLPEE